MIRNDELAFLKRKTIKSIVKKVKGGAWIEDLRIISFPRLFSYLDKTEIALVKKFLELDPRTYGFKGKFFSIINSPKDIIVVKEQLYTFQQESKAISEQYLPRAVYNAYQKLNRAYKQETGGEILFNSGYRSPAYQVVVFLDYLKYHQFDFPKTAERIAFPGYSEHGAPERQALDFMTMQGIPSEKISIPFDKTKEYRWLQKNAHKFGFYLSYPKNNENGIMYEPWHWHFENPSTRRKN